jgi:hypothetical protein
VADLQQRLQALQSHSSTGLAELRTAGLRAATRARQLKHELAAAQAAVEGLRMQLAESRTQLTTAASEAAVQVRAAEARAATAEAQAAELQSQVLSLTAERMRLQSAVEDAEAALAEAQGWHARILGMWRRMGGATLEAVPAHATSSGEFGASDGTGFGADERDGLRLSSGGAKFDGAGAGLTGRFAEATSPGALRQRARVEPPSSALSPTHRSARVELHGASRGLSPAKTQSATSSREALAAATPPPLHVLSTPARRLSSPTTQRRMSADPSLRKRSLASSAAAGVPV